eukprot:GEMP01029093.1.p1 GENE.GEMP01029093.1~~GEMP01029093.1.p1  ORF type:complete len:524 (+),score=102.77 GEMP01029093.1:49-1572(+)
MGVLMHNLEVHSDKVSYSDTHITAKYDYHSTKLTVKDDAWVATPETTTYQFKTDRRVPKLGVMLVGLGGNNGTTVAAGLLANKHHITWQTKEGVQKPNYWGSLTQSSTVRIGNYNGKEAYLPFHSLLPMVNPDDIVLGGWDMSSMNLADAMSRAKVIDMDLQRQLRPHMEKIMPLRAAFDGSFIAGNQESRADNVIKGTKQEQVNQLRKDIREFKEARGLDKIVVLWSANTERYSEIREGLNDTKENILRSVENNESEVAPSTLYALACILEGVSFINGSPQNTFVPGIIELAIEKRVLIGGDDFKSGQTKMKSVLMDFLIGAGLKPTSIASYNHLGNNDGKNLSEPNCFRSKEISKSDVVNDMVASNPLLYAHGEKPDHCIVIKYLPNVGDSKRAMDEYTSDIFLNGKNTIVLHNTCEDSLLAAPLIIDLVLLAELISRIELRKGDEEFRGFHPIAVLLSYLTKAPLVPAGTPCINALSKQRAMLENIFRACVGLPPDNNMLLEFK